MREAGGICAGDGPKPMAGGIEAIRDFAGVPPIGLIPAVPVLPMRKALKAEGDEASGRDRTFVAAAPGIFASVAPVASGRFAMDAIAHPAVPRAAMVNDMPEMVQNG